MQQPPNQYPQFQQPQLNYTQPQTYYPPQLEEQQYKPLQPQQQQQQWYQPNNVQPPTKSKALDRTLWILVGVAIGLVFGLILGSSYRISSSTTTNSTTVQDSTQSTSLSQSTQASAQVTPTPIPTIAPISLSGVGQQASKKFQLQQGLAVFQLTHNGSSNIIFDILDSNGNVVDNIVNEIGSFHGSKAEGIQNDGTYLFDIQADGNWTISIQ